MTIYRSNSFIDRHGKAIGMALCMLSAISVISLAVFIFFSILPHWVDMRIAALALP